MSIPALLWAMDAKAPSAPAWAVLVALANHADADGVCFPSAATLARRTQLGHRTVQRAISALQQAGLVVLEEAGARGKANRYRLVTTSERRNVRATQCQSDAMGERVVPCATAAQPCATAAQPCATAAQPPCVTAAHQPVSFKPVTEPGESHAQAPEREASSEVGSAAGAFDAFWAAYPRHEGRVAAKRAWADTGPDAPPARQRPPLPELLASLRAQCAAKQASDPTKWLVFFPHACNWIRDARWGDTPPVVKSAASWSASSAPSGADGTPYATLIDLARTAADAIEASPGNGWREAWGENMATVGVRSRDPADAVVKLRARAAELEAQARAAA